MQVNHQLLTQINVIREVQQRVIELGARNTQVDTSSEVNQHLAATTNLRFKLNKMHSKITPAHGDPESLQADSSRKRARGYHAPTHENASLTTAKTEDAPVFTS